MYRLIRLGNCIHVFDEQAGRYVKSSYKNVATALNRNPLPPSRKKIYSSVQWKACSDTHCRARACQQHQHWVGFYTSGSAGQPGPA
jgi:hypothetical protein